MMKNLRFFAAIASAILALTGSVAFAASVNIGLCEGNISGTTSKTGSGVISAAMGLPASLFAQYDGATITGMRVALANTDDISDVSTWIRSEREGDNLAAATIAEPVEGWNEVTLNGGLSFDSSTDFVLGYSFTQSKSVKCIAVGGFATTNGCWVAKDGTWQDRSDNVDGALCVELTLTGDMVPGGNLTVSVVSFPEMLPYGDTFEAVFKVKNTANADINGYSYSYRIGDDGQESEIVAVDKSLSQYDEDEVTVKFQSDIMDCGLLIPVALTISAQGDELESDNTAIAYLTTYTETVPHKLLLEEFSTEMCSNCPRAIQTIAKMVELGYGDQFVQITHHVGYKTDWLTVDEDKAYMWFYGDNGTYAPAGMFDRTNAPDYHYGQGSDNEQWPVFGIYSSDSFEPRLQKALAVPAFVAVDAETNYDIDSRTLDIEASVSKLATFDAQCKAPRITVILIEDSILHHKQAGYEGDTTFKHRHVYRKCLSDIWGDELEFEGNEAVARYSYVLPDDWCDQYVEAVAFVSNYNADDRNDCRVFNATSVGIKEQSGVTGIAADAETVSVEYYNLQGMRVIKPCNGVFIKKVTYSDGSHGSKITKVINLSEK